MQKSTNNLLNTFVGESSAIQSIKDQLNVISGLDVTVFLQGELGTGKSLLASFIHDSSQRASKAIHTINCSALTEDEQFEQLFACDKTKSSIKLPGAVNAAQGATLYVKEISHLGLRHQARLFQFLESGRLPALDTPIDIRLLCDSSEDLYSLVKQGKFRNDLYYLLNRISIHIPPLRERREDIAVLMKHYLAFFAQQYFIPPVSLSKDILNRLVNYHWPGNIRELRNLCEKFALFSSDHEITEADLPQDMASAPGLLEHLRLPEQGFSLYELEKALLKKALQVNGGNQSRAANWLGLTRDTFLYRIRKYTIATK